MIDLSIGVDIVSIERIENILNSPKGIRFQHRIFTKSEIAYCQIEGGMLRTILLDGLQPRRQSKKLSFQKEKIKIHGLKRLKFNPDRMAHLLSVCQNHISPIIIVNVQFLMTVIVLLHLL